MARRAWRCICSTRVIPVYFLNWKRSKRSRRRCGPCLEKTTIAAHVDHVHFGLTILNRWASCEVNPWASEDWNGSWQRTAVDEVAWQTRRVGLLHKAEKWRQVIASRMNWDDMGAAAALSTATHTAYHFGAIRQILAGLNR